MIFVNPEDGCLYEKVWCVQLHSLDIEGVYVCAKSEKDALDIAVDYHADRNPGFFLSEEEAQQHDEEDPGYEVLRAGNYSLPLAEGANVRITPMRWEHVRSWYGPFDSDFELHIWDIHKKDVMGKWRLAYAFRDTSNLRPNPERCECVFAGRDFACSPMHAIDSDETVKAILTFLSLQEGDVDAEYFETYSAEQEAWRDLRAENLSMEIYDGFNQDEEEE